MKILHVLNHFMPTQTAGTEVYCWALCKQLQNSGIKAEVVIPNYGKNESSEYEYDGIRVFMYAEPTIVDRALNVGLREPEGLNFFVQHLINEKPDIIHFHEIANSNAITIFHIEKAKKLGFRVLMTMHVANYTCKTAQLFYKGTIPCNGKIDLYKCGNCYLYSKSHSAYNNLINISSLMLFRFGINSLKLNNRMGTALGTVFLINELRVWLEKISTYCDKTVVLTKWFKEVLELNNFPEEKLVYIPQGLPSKKKTVELKTNLELDIPLKIVYLGRINRSKGLHLLIDVLMDIDENLVQLDIFGAAGDVDYENCLKSKSAAKSNIKWKGQLKQDNVIDTLANYSLSCLCSTVCEMSPLIIQESFAAGIPVLASDVLGNAEQIEHGYNGLLFKFNDKDSLKEQLLRCIEEPELIKKIKSNIVQPRQFTAVCDEYLRLYQNLN